MVRVWENCETAQEWRHVATNSNQLVKMFMSESEETLTNTCVQFTPFISNETNFMYVYVLAHIFPHISDLHLQILQKSKHCLWISRKEVALESNHSVFTELNKIEGASFNINMVNFNVYHILPTLQLAIEEFCGASSYLMYCSESLAKLSSASKSVLSTKFPRLVTSSLRNRVLHFIVRVQ